MKGQQKKYDIHGNMEELLGKNCKVEKLINNKFENR